MRIEITPEPDEQERRAILAALAAAAGGAGGSAWTRAALPGRGAEEDGEA